MSDLKITTLGLDGFGYTDEDFPVPFALAGETVEVTVQPQKGRIEPWGKVETIAEPSPLRGKTACPHFTSCGGCQMQHLTPDAYTQTMKEFVIRQGLPEDKVRDPIIIGPHKRRRADYMAMQAREGLVMGFSQFKGNFINDMHQCPAIHSELEALIPDLRVIFADILNPREKIHIFQTVADNGIDLLLAGWKRDVSEDECQRFIALSEKHNICRLRIKIKKRYHTLIEENMPQIHFGQTPVEVQCNAFLQASKDSDQILSQLVLENLPKEATKVVDLFCGRGTLSLPMIDAGLRVQAYECDLHATTALRNTQTPNLEILDQNLFTDPLRGDDLNQFEAIVINPPRAGAETQSQQIAASQVKRVIYVSCSPETFARDTKILQNGGYEIDFIQPVDQFIWTPHVEVVACFSKT